MGRKKNKKQQFGLDELFNENIMSGGDDEAEQEQDEKNAAEKSGGVMLVRLSLVEPDKRQPRKKFDDEKLGELADSIRRHGIIQPLLVRPLENGGYRIVAGERRWRAARLAGLSEIPVVVRELDNMQTMQIALIENLQRADLTPIEEARGYQLLMAEYNMTQLELAQSLGKPRSSIANSLRLLDLAPELQRMIERGSLTEGHAKVLAGLEGDAQRTLALESIMNGLSVRELEARRDEYLKQQNETEKEKQKREKAVKKRTEKQKYLMEAELSLKEYFSVPVSVKQGKGGRMSITLTCKDDEEFKALMSRLS